MYTIIKFEFGAYSKVTFTNTKTGLKLNIIDGSSDKYRRFLIEMWELKFEMIFQHRHLGLNVDDSSRK